MSLNANPQVYAISNVRRETDVRSDRAGSFAAESPDDETAHERFDALEIFEHLRYINDPEHPLSLEQLKVIQLDLIKVNDADNSIAVSFTPTIPHCSMATLIGLCIRVKLIRSLPSRFKVDVTITPGTHASEAAVNKQLNDKERVAAALENTHLLNVVNKCIANTHAGRAFVGGLNNK